MSTILIFIDAENMSKSQALKAYEEAKRMSSPEDIILGKFYGVKENLGDLVQFYLSLGFEFVDTSIYAEQKKNLTDMKIITDTVFDIVNVFPNELKAVFILSNDCDFNPLICKLKAYNTQVIGASSFLFGSIDSVDALASYLKIQRFTPASVHTINNVLYDSIVDLTRDMLLDDTLIIKFLRTRINKLASATLAKYRYAMRELSDDEIRQFSFASYNNLLEQAGYCNVEENLKLFTNKMFGSTLDKNGVAQVVMKIRGDNNAIN
jgi:hypothetical protein